LDILFQPAQLIRLVFIQDLRENFPQTETMTAHWTKSALLPLPSLSSLAFLSLSWCSLPGRLSVCLTLGLPSQIGLDCKEGGNRDKVKERSASLWSVCLESRQTGEPLDALVQCGNKRSIAESAKGWQSKQLATA